MTIDTNFQTPPEVCKYMANMVPNGPYNVMEPTAGVGNLYSALLKRDLKSVYAPTDFFLTNPQDRYDYIVMNPPFSSKSAFLDNAPEGIEKHGMKLGYYILTECMKRSDNVIALMPWFTISDSDVRLRMIKRFGLKSITALPRKTFEYVRIQTCILEMEKGYTGDTKFIVYDCLNDLNTPKLELSTS